MIEVSIDKQESKAPLQVRVVTPADLKGKPRWQVISPELAAMLAEKFSGEHFKAEPGKKVAAAVPGEKNFLNLLFVGAAKKNPGQHERLEAYRRLGAAIFEEAKRLRIAKVDLYEANLDLADRLNQTALVEGLGLAAYRFDRYRSDSSDSFAGVTHLHTPRQAAGATPAPLQSPPPPECRSTVSRGW